MSKWDFEEELERIFQANKCALMNELENISYSVGCADVVHDSVEAYIAEKYGEDVLKNEDWMEDYFDEVADIVVPMMYGLTGRAVTEYLDEGAKAVEAPKRRAAEVLEECGDLMQKKGAAYNGFPQAEYYPYGLRDIWYMCFTKVKRLESQIVRDGEANFEGVEDSARDLINYAAFLIEFAEGKMNGQKKD